MTFVMYILNFIALYRTRVATTPARMAGCGGGCHGGAVHRGQGRV